MTTTSSWGVRLRRVEYTGKALFGLCKELKIPRLDNAENILFIHTGGIFGLFPKAAEISF